VQTLPAGGELFSLTRDFGKAYENEKRRRNWADFSDLEHMALKLLTNPEEGDATQLAKALSERYREVMIDEYQDTNEVQDIIFTALSDDGKKLFMVGDVKQSIYRFRLADPGIFLNKYNSFADFQDAKENEPRRIIMSKNFRSRPEIIDAVNGVFAKLMTGGYAQVSYGEKEMLYSGRACVKGAGETEDYFPEFQVIDVPQSSDEEEESVNKTEIE
jgi:ATP-dependent helicase/nuclease subunit A